MMAFVQMVTSMPSTSASGHSRQFALVHSGSAQPPIAGEVFKGPFGRSGPEAEVRLFRRSCNNTQPEPPNGD